MIEIVTDKERNLKNLKQIGTPKEENKIYVEHLVYSKIKENTYKDKRVFVLMGHTERMEGRYATFVEGVIPIREIEFHGNTPRWNNSTWSEIFREIKRLYEDMIIVGWALDIKGMLPKVTPDLERVHREHFGGVHQVLFLLDTIEGEETFYMYKENKVVPKDGFYIYHKARKRESLETYERNETNEPNESKREIIPVKVLEQKREKANQQRRQESQVDVEVDFQQEQQKKRPQGGRYRKLMNEKKTKKPTDDGNLGIAIAVTMLIFVIGVGIYEDRGNIFGTSNSVETNAGPEQQNNNAQIPNQSEEAAPSNSTQYNQDVQENAAQSNPDMQDDSAQTNAAQSNQNTQTDPTQSDGAAQTNSNQSNDNTQLNPTPSNDSVQTNQIQSNENTQSNQIQSNENTQMSQTQPNDGAQTNPAQSNNNPSSEVQNTDVSTGEDSNEVIPVEVISGTGT